MTLRGLLMLAVVLTIVGLVGIFLIRPEFSPTVLQLSGVVKGVHESGGMSFVDVVPVNFTVVAFHPLPVGLGNHTFFGRLQEYKGKVEFVVEKYD